MAKAKKARTIGLAVSPPETACDDRACPWHGSLPVRGRTFTGTVRSAKAQHSAVVEWPFIRYVAKYDRSMRQSSRVVAHNPACIHAREGETVVIAECRPLSKTKHFVVVGRSSQVDL